MIVRLDIPEDLALRLQPVEDQLPQILELGLRELQAMGQSGFEGAAEVFEVLAGLPSAEEILKLRPSLALQARISELLEKNRTVGLTPAEEQQWQQYQYLEHLVRMAKANAAVMLKAS